MMKVKTAKKPSEDSDEDKSDEDKSDEDEDNGNDNKPDFLLSLLPAFHTSDLERNAVEFKVGNSISPIKFVIVIVARQTGKQVIQDNFEFKILEFADEKSGSRGVEKTYLDICGEHIELDYVVHHFDVVKK